MASLMDSLAAAVAAAPAARSRVRSIRSGWWRRKSTDEMVPTAPSAATLPASRCAEMPMPMPPCTMGNSVRPPRVNGERPPGCSNAINPPAMSAEGGMELESVTVAMTEAVVMKTAAQQKRTAWVLRPRHGSGQQRARR